MMMPTKGLFNRNENNEDEIKNLIKRVMALEQQVRKIDALDVDIKRLRNLESKFPSTEEDFFKRLAEFMLQMLAPIQEKMNDMEDRIVSMENNYSMLEKIMEENRQQTAKLKNELEKAKNDYAPKKAEQPVVIREIRVDKILLDKYEQNNNFGYLGIKELGGQLNIGATYGTSTLPAEIAEELKDDFESFKQVSEMESPADESSDEASEESSEDPSWEPGPEADESRDHQKFGGQDRAEDEDGYFTDIPIE